VLLLLLLLVVGIRTVSPAVSKTHPLSKCAGGTCRFVPSKQGNLKCLQASLEELEREGFIQALSDDSPAEVVHEAATCLTVNDLKCLLKNLGQAKSAR